MSSDADLLAAIEAHRRAAADHEAAAEARRLAGVRLCGMRPSSLDGAIAFLSYLSGLGDELAPGLAQLAAVCRSMATDVASRRVVKGPEKWWAKAAAD
jgi:hypothetical protein